jgi:pilus assembly protein CpaB
MSRRIGLLAVALVVALLGTTAVFSYVSKVEAKSLTGAEPVDVLVASERLASGTTGTAVAASKLVQLVPMPRESVPEGALTSLDAVAAQSLVSDVFAGEVLLRAKFADQTAQTGNLVIPKDKIALAVSLGDPQRVAGFVVPGSEVAIFLTVANDAGTSDGGAAQDSTVTRLLLPRTSVIAVGPSTLQPVESAEAAQPDDDVVAKAILTVAVTQKEAERLVHATQSGSLYLGLLSGSSKTAPDSGITNSNLFQ